MSKKICNKLMCNTVLKFIKENNELTFFFFRIKLCNTNR